MRAFQPFYCVFSLTIGALLFSCSENNSISVSEGTQYQTWSDYLGDPGRSHFSTLNAFTPENVGSLTLAWEHALQDSG
ncbi:hypothetical protein, partial [Robiginitalea sp.]|uniref:hypothetical protein n=1 Tax=Robiginitalea sp. TaxID=1902411 RepID=UPI003C3F61A0